MFSLRLIGRSSSARSNTLIKPQFWKYRRYISNSSLESQKQAQEQHRAALTEEYAEIEQSEENGEGEEFYVDCSNIKQRWNKLPMDIQQDMISYLNVKQEFGWNYLTREEKQSLYYIAYGEWGARDKVSMNGVEMAFKLMTSCLLFVAMGITIINYMHDKKVIEELEDKAAIN